MGTYNERPRNNSSASNSRHGSAYDQSYRSRCCGAYNRPDFKYEKRTEKNPFDVEFGVELAKEELEAAIRQQICGAIPAYIVEGIEVTRDFGNSSGNNGAILGEMNTCK